jgi:hypothetical protein
MLTLSNIPGGNMSINIRFAFTLLLVFAYSVTQTAPALADDGTPPTEEGASDSGVTDPAAETVPTLPEETALVVVDETGNSLPLATEAAAQALTEGDPMWCPTGVAPKAGTSGCSPSFNRFGSSGDIGSLIDWLVTNQPNKAGTVWVEYNYNSGVETATDIVFAGADYNTMDKYALTIQGGWEGIPLKTWLYNPDPYSYFNSTFSVVGWTGAVTLNNIAFDGVTTNVADPIDTINVATKGNITLNSVKVWNSDNIDDSNTDYVMSGAFLYNDGTGTVTVNNSDFSKNEGDGLFILSTGAITTNSLVANYNGGLGALIANDYLVQGKPVTMKGLAQFNNNGSSGLYIYSYGVITVGNILANNNGGQGAFLDNRESAANSGITLNGTNYVMNNAEEGIVILSHGAITANNLTASDNDGTGAFIDNCDFDGPDCKVTLAKTIKLTGVNTFTRNGLVGDEGGLIIQSIGAITVNNLIASGNYGDGAKIDNQFTNFNAVDATGTWTLSGYGIFQDNTGDGLVAFSFGNTVLANINASNNLGDGLHVNVYKTTGGTGITLNGVSYFTGNGEDGLDLSANGQITVNNITSSFNDEMGANIDNLYSTAKPYNVTLKGTNTFNDNGTDGLNVHSFGSITVNNLVANNNGIGGVVGSGAVLDNCLYTSTCAAVLPKSVTVTGYVTVNDNFTYGLEVVSLGAITVTNVTAERNHDAGISLANNILPANAQAVILKGSNTFTDNVGTGLIIYSFGSITANNVLSVGNDAWGAYLYNVGSLTPKNITLTGASIFSNNAGDGLTFESSGSVFLNRVTAMGNGSTTESGIDGTAVNITVICVSTINNAGKGYTLTASDGLSIKGLYSAWNGLSDFSSWTNLLAYNKTCLIP